MKIKATLVAAVAVLALAGCGGTTDRQGDALKAVTGWTQALSDRNYGVACGYYSKSNLRKTTFVFQGATYTPIQYCAIGLENNEVNSIMFGALFYVNLKVIPQPTSGAPKNGYAFKVTYATGSIVVAVQRDSEGAWKIVGVSG